MSCANRRLGRCLPPLIEVCDTTSQIKLDLGACDPCPLGATALLLRKSGCPEYEVVCEEIPAEVCCGVIDNRPRSRIFKTARLKPKPSVIYPLHEVDPEGMSVFVLDGKLKQLGYGRYEAIVLIDGAESDVHFAVDYIKGRIGLNYITTQQLQANLGEC